jgi:hypothetical protein
MKKNKIIVMAAAAAFLQVAAVQDVAAQDIVPVNIHTLRATESGGKLYYNKFGNKEYIARCAADNGITNTSGLHLVYVRSANAIVVTDGTNAICAPLTFVNAVEISNTNKVQAVERMVYVFPEGASIATGTMAVTEHHQIIGETNRLVSMVGQIQYWVDNDGTNGTAIYRGTVTSSSSSLSNNGNSAGNNGNGGGSHTNNVPPAPGVR